MTTSGPASRTPPPPDTSHEDHVETTASNARQGSTIHVTRYILVLGLIGGLIFLGIGYLIGIAIA